MDISLFGYKISLEILILIGIVYLILVIHTVVPCMNMPLLYEGLSNMATDASGSMMSDPKMKKPAAPSTATSTANAPTSKKEGYSGMNLAEFSDTPAPYKLGDYSQIDTSKWMNPNLVVTPGQPLPADVQKFLDRPKQPVPLPEGELLMFANNKFTPGACPNTYSNSMGCVEMTVDQYNYIGPMRGGNNVPYSEY